MKLTPALLGAMPVPPKVAPKPPVKAVPKKKVVAKKVAPKPVAKKPGGFPFAGAAAPFTKKGK